jgi:hypothetical protein
MADTKISALTDGNPAQSGDEIPIARSGANYKITAGSIASLGGDVDGPASSVDNQIALFDSTTGKLIKAATTTGVLKASSGVIAAATSGTDYVAPAGAFSGLSWQSVQTTGFTAVAFRAYPCDTTSAAFTVTLPASPSAGDQITLTDYAGTFSTNNLTINPNGGKIRGSTDNAVISTSNNSVQFVYVDSTQGWIVYAAVSSTPFAPPPPNVSYLVVAGGASGAPDRGGGGGAGGFRTNSSYTVTSGVAYNVTVGAGGASTSAPSSFGNSGSVSSWNTTGVGGGVKIESAGGGGGQGGGGGTGVAGGSGGGAGNPGTGGAGDTPSTSPAQGNAGGNASGSGPNFGASGGGGAGAIGGAGTSTAGGNGGAGLSSDLSGSTLFYAAGGGGGVYITGTTGTGGSSIGGNGGTGGVAGTAASPANRGSGGGGGGGNVPAGAGGAGSSGVVIVVYPSTYAAAVSTTGSPTVTVSGGYRRYVFTGNGSITW